jgi:hypothetical protein
VPDAARPARVPDGLRLAGPDRPSDWTGPLKEHSST